AFVFFMVRCPPTSPLFPYTTLFRSELGRAADDDADGDVARANVVPFGIDEAGVSLKCRRVRRAQGAGYHASKSFNLTSSRNLGRSEEHTSELQSRRDIVCRLLLEKK